MPCTLRRDSWCLPITAIQAVDDQVVLTGQGPCVYLTDCERGSVYAHICIFDNQAVHGIATVPAPIDRDAKDSSSTYKPQGGGSVREISSPTPSGADDNVGRWCILCWGGTSLASLKLQRTSVGSYSLAVVCHEFLTDDWVLTASFSVLTSDCELLACMVTAHNVLLGIRFGESNIEQISKGTKSILYSSHLRWLSPSRVLIAGGTVFGEVIVWSSDIFGSQRSDQLHYILRGHLGSVFGVSISAEIQWKARTDQPARLLLASCSDDRTIRIWDISRCITEAAQDDDQFYLNSALTRVTGFDADATETSSSSVSCCVAVAWGHISRIWGIHFLNFEKSSDELSMHLASRGEDATCQLWKLEFPQAESFVKHQDSKLVKMASFDYHVGKNLWSLAFTSWGSKCRFYSGGADGSILTYEANLDLEHCLSEGAFTGAHAFETLLSGLRSTSVYSIPEPQGKRKNSVISALKNYSFVDDRRFLATSDQGLVVCGTVEHRQRSLTWEAIGSFKDLESWSIIASSSKTSLAFVVGANGEVRCYDRNRLVSKLAELPRKPAGLFCLDAANIIGLLVTFLGLNDGHLFFMLTADREERLTPAELGEPIVLVLPATFIVTSACIVGNEELLVIGSRSGALAVYYLRDSQKHLSDVGCFRRIHGEDTVTSMLEIRHEKTADHDSVYLLTCGRDGHYCLLLLKFAHGRSTLQTLHRSSLPFGPNVEGVDFDSRHDLIFYGFRSKEFVVWNETQQLEVLAIECGGAHRTWAYRPAESGGNFIWTKASTFNIYSTLTPCHRIIQRGGHGREIKAVAIRPVIPGEDSARIMATGAEDTTIRIFSIQGQSESAGHTFRCLRILKKHTTGIQHLQWSECGEYLFSSSGSEEFFAWRVRMIPDFGLGIVCEAAAQKKNAEADLRITRFDVRRNQEGFIVSMAYSNSEAKVFLYNTTATVKGFQLFYCGTYGANCLTDIALVTFPPYLHMVSTSTDGHIASWDLRLRADDSPMMLSNSTIAVETRHQIHQNSIKASAILSLSKSEVLIVTGGDDNSLALTRVSLMAEYDFTLPKWSTLVIPNAHAAAVNAVLVFQGPRSSTTDDKEVHKLTIVSSGNDQRLKVWEVHIALAMPGTSGIEVGKGANVSSAVADISCMDVLDDTPGQRSIVICGIGMELWSLEE